MSQNQNSEKGSRRDAGSWRYIEEGLNGGAYNMAVDAAMLQCCEPDSGTPTLRLYGWETPTLSIGYSQPVGREIDRSRLVEQGIPWVRRPTGGRAILHEQELTYSVVAPVSHPLFSGGLKTTFSAISEALLKGLTELGLDHAQVNREKKANPEPGLRSSPSCFALLNHCEITVDGRKLVGSAQRRTQTAFVQHGSVLIHINRPRLNSVLKFADDYQRARNLEVLQQNIVTLSEVCDLVPGFSDVRAAVRRGFEAQFGGSWIRGELSAREQSLLRSLLPEPAAPVFQGAFHD